MGYKKTILKMQNIYGETNVDWMGYEITEENPLTYHHIKKRNDGGLTNIRNGALLSKEAHNKLNIIEYICPELYEEYEFWFELINDMKCTPTFEILQIMKSLKIRTEQVLENFYNSRKNQYTLRLQNINK